MDQGWFLRRFPSRNGTSTCCLYLGFKPRLWKKCVLMLSQAWWMKWNGKFLFILIILDKPPIIHLFPFGYFSVFHCEVCVQPQDRNPEASWWEMNRTIIQSFKLAISTDKSERAIYISEHFSALTSEDFIALAAVILKQGDARPISTRCISLGILQQLLHV